MDIVTYALLNGKIKDYASNVDEWLEENVDPATGYVLDRSLQMENAAAPADIVGDINDDVGELRNTLNTKADEESLALKRSGTTNTGAQIETGTFFYLDGTLKRAIATIAQNASFTAQNCETFTAGALNDLTAVISPTLSQETQSNYSLSSVYCRKIGKLVSVQFSANCTTPYTAYPGINVLSGLPLQLDTLYANTAARNSADADAVRIIVENGYLKLRYGAAQKDYDIQIMYFSR
jgi:hypothetical protein